MPTIRAFFERYAKGYLALDPALLSPFFDLPCMVVDDQGDHIMAKEDELLAYEKPFIAQLRRQDVRAIETTVIAAHTLDDTSCLCTVRYRLEDQHRRAISDFDYHYILVGDGTDWHIKFAKIGKVRHSD